MAAERAGGPLLPALRLRGGVLNFEPRYPVYVPTKGRSAHALTLRCLLKEEVPFLAVVEPQEIDAYAEIVGHERLLVLPENGVGLLGARNFIMDHAIEQGHARHWQLDDNIIEFRRLHRGRRIPCSAGVALRVCEDLSDRYSNVAVSGLNYQMFVPADTKVPFRVNVHVYSCTLVNNASPYRWRMRYNDDTDLCLQVLAGGWCTILVNVFMANKMRTMALPGGNTDDLYGGDGRLRMARDLERMWPGVVTVERRWQRPQHVINWKRFDTRLKPKSGRRRKDGGEYGLTLREVQPVKSASLREAAGLDEGG